MCLFLGNPPLPCKNRIYVYEPVIPLQNSDKIISKDMFEEEVE